MSNQQGVSAIQNRGRPEALLIIVLLVLVVVTAGCRAVEPSKPVVTGSVSVLLITVDTLRADALGSYGRAGAQTPWIDRLASRGVRFDRARAHNVTTLASHANILSGRYPFDHGVRDNAGFRFPDALPTLASVLKARGYRTGAFISAFPLDSRFGLDRGFDVYDDEFVGAATQKAFLVQERSGTETVKRARQWLDSQGGAPTFCWVHLYEPHFPYAPPEPLASTFKSSLYDGEVAATDLALRPLLEPILSAGNRSGTLVVVTSDHGESLGEHGEATHGIFAYESTLRVPLIVHEPQRWQPAVVSTPVQHVDILPTILDALALQVPGDLRGRSLVPLMTGSSLSPAPTYFEALSGSLNRGWAPLHGVIQDEVKLIDLPIAEIYDLAHDAAEGHNLAPQAPQRVSTLRAQLTQITGAGNTTARSPEDPDTRERLRSLGYLAGSAPRRERYTEQDDPKKLIELDTVLQQVVGKYLDGDLPGALAQCRELVRRRPGMAVSLLYLAHLERETGHLDAGIDALRKASAINGDDDETLALLGAYLTEAGRAREAVDRLKLLAERDRGDVNVLASYALALARLGQTANAVSALDRAQVIDPSNAMLHVHEGTVRLMADDRRQARNEFETAVKLSPDAARAHSSLGILAAEDGNAAAAVAHWNRAVAVDPREYRTILGVGLALARSGKRTEARPYLEYFSSSAPRTMYAPELQLVTRLLGGKVESPR